MVAPTVKVDLEDKHQNLKLHGTNVLDWPIGQMTYKN